MIKLKKNNILEHDSIISVYSKMIPEHLIESIITESLILTKNENGWKKIHKRIKSPMHLKSTDNVDELKNIKYDIISRVENLFLVGKKYTWLKKLQYSNKYYYESEKPKLSVNDIYSTDENGNLLDDDIDYAYIYY